MSHPSETLYRRWIEEVWGRGDMAACDAIVASDLIDHNPIPGLPPGRASHDAVLHMIRTAFPDLCFEVDVCFAHGDLVTGHWTMTGTHTGPLAMADLGSTGRAVRMTGQEIFRVHDGRLVEIWHNENVAGLLGQLGLMGPPPAQ